MASSSRAKYVMSVAAELVDMHPQTLRKYERAGLLEPARYDGYHRMYSDDDVARLTALRELAQEQRINIAGLRILMDVLGFVERMERLLDHPSPSRAKLRQEVSQLREVLGMAEPG